MYSESTIPWVAIRTSACSESVSMPWETKISRTPANRSWSNMRRESASFRLRRLVSSTRITSRECAGAVACTSAACLEDFTSEGIACIGPLCPNFAPVGLVDVSISQVAEPSTRLQLVFVCSGVFLFGIVFPVFRRELQAPAIRYLISHPPKQRIAKPARLRSRGRNSIPSRCIREQTEG